jgi:hypothetical protein
MNKAAPLPGLLTELEAAKWLSISPRTLRKLRQDGKVHYVLIRTAVRYTLDDLILYVEGARTACLSTNEKAPRSGGTASPSPTVADFEEARRKRQNAKRA